MKVEPPEERLCGNCFYNPGREPYVCQTKLKQVNFSNPGCEQWVDEIYKNFGDYEKATCKTCKNFPENGYCLTKRAGVIPTKSACNRYIAEGTPEKEPEKEPELPPHIKDEANKVLETGDPVKYIFDAHQRLHIGDHILTLTRITAVGNQSASNTKGIQPSADGGSGKGKSDGDKKFVHLLPKEYVLSGSISDKVLYYKKDLKPGTYIYSDDVVLSEDLISTIKRATSNFQQHTPHHTLDKDRNVLENYIPPRIVWGLNSVDNVNSLQLINRQFGCSVDESTEQDERVLLYQKKCGMLGTNELPETDDVLICREIIRDIKKHIFKVIIPFNYLIEWKDASNRRNFDMFEDMIRGFAVFRYKQRETHGDILIAELQDFKDAEDLYGNRTEQQGRQLTDSELKLITVLNKVEIADSKELQILTGFSQGRISHLMKGKGKDSDSGLIHKVKELHYEKTSVATKTGATTKMFYSLSGFDENAYKNKVVWIDEKAREEFSHYYHTITTLLLSKIKNREHTITTNTTNTILHSNNKYNDLLHSILNIHVKNGNSGNNGNSEAADSVDVSNSEVIVLHVNTCGSCDQPLKGQRVPGPSGSGDWHSKCIKLHQAAIKLLTTEYATFTPDKAEISRLIETMDTKLNTELDMDKRPAQIAVQAFCQTKGWRVTA